MYCSQKLEGVDRTLQQCLLCFVPRKLLRKPDIHEGKINPTSKKIRCQRRACLGSIWLQHDSGVLCWVARAAVS